MTKTGICMVAFSFGLICNGCQEKAEESSPTKAPQIDPSVTNSLVGLAEVANIARLEVNSITPHVQYVVLTNDTRFDNGLWTVLLWKEDEIPEGGVFVTISTNGSLVGMYPDLWKIHTGTSKNYELNRGD